MDFLVMSKEPSIIWIMNSKIEDRIDVNPYKIEHIENDKILANSIKTISISEALRNQRDLTGGATPLGANYLNKGIKFIRTQNVQRNTIDLSDVVYISKEDNEKSARSKLEENDILLTITGADFGRIAPVRKGHLPANINQHSVRLHFKESIDPYFISTYLNSKYGQSQIFKYSIGATRPAIDYSAIRKIKIPIPSPEIQKYIGDKVRRAEELREEAKKLKEEAEEILNSKIQNLPDDAYMDIKHNWVLNNNIEHRIDPNFYQKKYMDILEKMGVKRDKLDNYAKRVNRKLECKDKNLYIEIGDVDTNYGLILKKEKINKEDIPTSAKYKVKKGEIIVSLVRPTRKAIAIITSEVDNALCTSGFTVLKPKLDISAEFLTAVLRTDFVTKQFERYCAGSTYPTIKDDDVLNIYIPQYSDDEMSAVTKLYTKIINNIQLSKQLIQEAKQDVEDLIEGNFIISKLNKTTTESR